MTATDPLRPQHWDDYIGQAQMKLVLETSIRAARAQARPLDSIFLWAPPGAGKTSLAEIIAARLGEEILTIPAKTMSLRQIRSAIMGFPGGILFLDEIHGFSTAEQEALLPLVLEGRLTVDGKTVEHDWLTVIGATTEKADVIKPLRERFKIVPVFDDYSDEDMARIALSIAERVGLDLSEDTALVLGKAAAGIPRAVQKLVLNARDIAAAYDRIPSATEILAFARVDTEGLTHDHQQYLKRLKTAGGTCGVSNLANMLQCTERDLRQLERLLFDRGYITFESRGRELTATGWRKVNGNASPRARRTLAPNGVG